MPATLGTDIQTGQPVTIGDIERRSGLYVLGKPGMGKTTLLVNLMLDDIKSGIASGHGLFFLDPHGDAIDDLYKRCLSGERLYILDPQDETHSFGLNLLSCRNISSLKERTDTYARAYGVFQKLWEQEWGPWLQLIIQNTLYVFIENPDYTIADVPLFLIDQGFRNHLVAKVKHNADVVYFWKNRFGEKRDYEQQRQVDAALTRVSILLGHPYIRHIIGQQKTTIDFSKVMQDKRIFLVKLSANLPADIKKFIGTILLSEFLHAVRERPEGNREQFSIFVDEFQNYANSDHLGTLITEARKFGIATTISHQERFGQLSENPRMLGATSAAANKVFFQLTVADAQELAPEFAKPPPAETRLERELVVSQTPVADLLRGHANAEIRAFVNAHLRPMHEQLEEIKEEIEGDRILRMSYLDEAGLSRVEERVEHANQDYVRSHAALQTSMRALLLAQNQTEKLKSLHERSRVQRQALRALNMFFIAVMEGRVRPGQEQFSGFLIDRMHDSSHIPDQYAAVFALYISLQYGDSQLPRVIPVALAQSYTLLPQVLTQVQQEAAENARRKKEAELQSYWERSSKTYAAGLAEELQVKQQKAECVLLELTSKCDKYFHIPDSDDLIEAYIPLLAYPSVQETLRPYYTARFASPLQNLFHGYFFKSLSDLLESVRDKQKDMAEIRESYGLDKKPSRFTAVFSSKQQSKPISDGRYAIEEALYAPCLLTAYEQFLEQYGEGALVVLGLLYTAIRPRSWDKWEPLSPSEYPYLPSHWEFYSREKYPWYNVLYVPSVAKRDPLEIFQVLDRLTGILYRQKYTVDFAKYFWRIDGKDPYTGPKSKTRYRSDSRLLHLHIERRDVFTNMLQSRQDALFQRLKSLFSGKALLYEEVGTLRRADALLEAYLQNRACDIVRYGRKVADIAYPQPTIIGDISEDVDQMVMVMVRQLQEVEKEEEKKQEKEWRAQHEEYAQREIIARYTNQVIPLPQTLAPRTLSSQEREAVKEACRRELSRCEPAQVMLRVITDFVQFCDLLSRPENRLVVPSEQYVQKAVNTRTVADMTHEMAQELSSLPRFTAYVKVIQEQSATQTVVKRKMKTNPFSIDSIRECNFIMEYLGHSTESILKQRYAQYLEATRVTYCKPRTEIEAEIQKRQEPWVRTEPAMQKEPEMPPATES